MTDLQILIIANPLAQGGKARATLTAYQDFLKHNQIQYFLYCTKGRNDAAHVHKLFEINTFHKVVILGGDGTINIATNALPNLAIPVNIIPAGTGNDFAKMIYKTINLQDIFKRSISEESIMQKVDIWTCNNRRFVNGFGAGFDGAIANRTVHNDSFLPSGLKYILEITKQLMFYTTKSFTVNGVKYPTFMISAANGSVYGGSFKVAPDADIADKLLEVVRIKKVYTALRLLFLPLMLLGKHMNRPSVEASRENEVHISSTKKLPAHVDGEPLLEHDYHIKYEGQINLLC